MRPFGIFFAAFLAGLSISAKAQTAATDHPSIIAFAQKAAVRAVDCRQGDAASLTDAQNDFTADGWKDFMKHMEGFLDAKGAPTFTAIFVPSKGARWIDEKEGLAHVRLPGTLKQTHDHSITSYRGDLDVYVS